MADFAINSLDKWNKLVYHSKTIFILTIVIITLTIFFGFLSGIRWGVYGGIAIFVGVLIAWGISFGVTSLVIDAILQKLDFDKVSQGYIKKRRCRCRSKNGFWHNNDNHCNLYCNY